MPRVLLQAAREDICTPPQLLNLNGASAWADTKRPIVETNLVERSECLLSRHKARLFHESRIYIFYGRYKIIRELLDLWERI